MYSKLNTNTLRNTKDQGHFILIKVTMGNLPTKGSFPLINLKICCYRRFLLATKRSVNIINKNSQNNATNNYHRTGLGTHLTDCEAFNCTILRKHTLGPSLHVKVKPNSCCIVEDQDQLAFIDETKL